MPELAWACWLDHRFVFDVTDYQTHPTQQNFPTIFNITYKKGKETDQAQFGPLKKQKSAISANWRLRNYYCGIWSRFKSSWSGSRLTAALSYYKDRGRERFMTGVKFLPDLW